MMVKNLKPNIRVYHNLARSGGTLISKCIASMQKVILFSEIHPYLETVDTIYLKSRLPQNIFLQAKNWHNLFTKKDIEILLSEQSRIDFVKITKIIYDKVNKLKSTLVLRDWTHLDFTTYPFLSSMSLELRTAKILENDFNIIQATSVRHPIDQWLSMKNYPILENIDIEIFLKGYKHFSEECKKIGFVRYEDFTIDPDKELKNLCNMLQIKFDKNYKNKWFNYKKITGDTFNTEEKKIIPYKKKEIDKKILLIFEKNNDYKKIIDNLGYEKY